MGASVYQDTGYAGAFMRLQAGSYRGAPDACWRAAGGSGGWLCGRTRPAWSPQEASGGASGQYNGEPLDKNISSVRVDANTVVALYDSRAPSSSGASRVVVGPVSISDLSALGFNDKTSLVEVAEYNSQSSGDAQVTVSSSYGLGGMRAAVTGGDYVLGASAELGTISRIASVEVGARALLILYASSGLDNAQDAVMIKGPVRVDDLEAFNFYERALSFRVLATGGPNKYGHRAGSGPELPASSGSGNSYYAPLAPSYAPRAASFGVYAQRVAPPAPAPPRGPLARALAHHITRLFSYFDPARS